MRIIRGLACAGLVLVAVGISMEVRAASAIERLEKGVYQEETAGNLAAAIQVYAALVREEQVNRQVVAEALYRLGKCYRKSGDPGKARQAFDELMNRFSDQHKFAESARRELASLPEAPRSAPTTANKDEAEKASARGWQLWQARKLSEAEAEFKKAVELDPSNANAWNGLGWAVSNQGRPAEAARAFEQVVRLEPKHAAALNGLGWSAYATGKADEAISWWAKAVEAAPNASAAWNGLATVYAERKEYDKAIEVLEKWLKVEPGSAEGQAALKRVRALSGGGSKVGGSASVPSAGTQAVAASGGLVSAAEQQLKELEQRAASGNTTWLDKNDLSMVYSEWARGNPTPAQKEAEMASVREFLARHAGNALFAWRLNHLLATAALDLGKTDEAGAYLDATLAAYPDTKYDDPSKQSKYQHIVNQRAELILEKDGLEAAEKYIVERLVADPKFDYPFTFYWSNAYGKKGLESRYPQFLQQVRAAYEKRKQTFPDKAAYIDRQLQSLR